MPNEGLGMGSLKMWAKEDNPDMYRVIMSNDIWTYINRAFKSGKDNSYDVARVLYVMYKDRYIYVSSELSYYLNQNGLWIEDEEQMLLRRRISTELYAEFSRLNIAEQQWSLESDDAHAQNAMKIGRVMVQLKNTAFKTKVMEQCYELFYDLEHTFINNIDLERNIVVFRNGVYELGTDIFREIKPEDYATKSLEIDYVDFSKSNLNVQKFIKQLLIRK